jgi:hypothetical protein
MKTAFSRFQKTLHAFALTLALSLAQLSAAPIPGLFNTGVDNTGAALPDNTVDPHYTITLNPDTGVPDAFVEDSQSFPIVAGPWLANTASSKWIGPRFNTTAAAGGDYEYLLTFDLTGFDPETAIITGRWASDNDGTEILLNGAPTHSPTRDQFSSYTDFRLVSGQDFFVEGTNTLYFRVNNSAVGYTGLRVEISGTALPPGSPPVIVDQPRSQVVAEGEQAYFQVLAQASPAPTYQWRHNGTNVPDGTLPLLTFLNAASVNAGIYDVVVSNPHGSVTSSVASLTVSLAMTNPSFEADTFNTFPGYVSGNGPITGWNARGGHGINPGPSSPFANNGTIPHGTKVAFMQEDGPMTQRIAGFTPGEIYYVHYYENSRAGNVPAIAVTITDDTNTLTLVAEHVVTSVGGANPYYEVFSQSFVATAAEMTLAFVKSNPRGGDNTVLVDNVAIVQIQATMPPLITQQPRGSVVRISDPIALSVNAIGGLPLSYQWRRDGSAITGATNTTFNIASALEANEGDYTVVITNAYGAVTSAVARVVVFEPILGLFNTGVDNSGAPLPDSALDPHYILYFKPDGTTIDDPAVVQTAIPGAWLANSATSKWIGPDANTVASAGGRYTYRTTIDLTGRDPSTAMIFGRWATDNPGLDIQVNRVSTTNAQSGTFAGYTAFALSSTNAAFVAGTNTIDFIVENAGAGFTGLRIEIDQSNVKIPPGTVPTITRHPAPQSQEVAIGDSVTFTGAGSGSAPLSYQWRRNGVAITGQTNATMTLTNLSEADSGNYTLAISNSAGTAVSDPANVCVCFSVVPGIFGTGLDDNGALLAPGAVDPHYTLTLSADPVYLGPESYVINDGWPIAPAGPWIANGPRSRWIAPRAEQNQQADPNFGNAPGSYTFQTTFDLFGVDLSSFHIQGRWAVDNTGTDILVNGSSSGITSPGFTAWTDFTITNGLIAGINTLDFIFSNAGTAVSPAGLRVDLRGLLRIGNAAPRLTITRQGNQVTVSWTPSAAGQQLQATSSLNGPNIDWQIVAGASNPMTFDASTGMRFFRITQP